MRQDGKNDVLTLYANLQVDVLSGRVATPNLFGVDYSQSESLLIFHHGYEELWEFVWVSYAKFTPKRVWEYHTGRLPCCAVGSYFRQ